MIFCNHTAKDNQYKHYANMVPPEKLNKTLEDVHLSRLAGKLSINKARDRLVYELGLNAEDLEAEHGNKPVKFKYVRNIYFFGACGNIKYPVVVIATLYIARTHIFRHNGPTW